MEFSHRASQKRRFEIASHFKPTGDQPRAIEELTEGLLRGDRHQTLLGVTGSGKTFTMANTIANVNRPTLIMSPNKTLAAQLFGEFKQFFPRNHVEFFISYYDYYQPEAYIPQTDTYIEKDLSINDEIDRMRLRATSALVSGVRDVVIVASVSCIYGIGSPEEFRSQICQIKAGDTIRRNDLLLELLGIFYERNDVDFKPGSVRVRGDVVDIFPAYFEEEAYRVTFWGDEVEKITRIHPVSGETLGTEDFITIYPAKIFVTPQAQIDRALETIREELNWRLAVLREDGRLLEAQRLEQRTRFDLEMIREVGYCSGIENYSRHLTGRNPGEPPFCLIDYFPDDFLLIMDESHISVSQVGAMYNGDRSRKLKLVEHGFRLPSALDNRPLKFSEFEEKYSQVVYVSATPADYELDKSGGVIVEQIIRPTGLLDPAVEVRPSENQIDDLLEEIQKRIEKSERVLVTVLTKRMAEELAAYLSTFDIRVRYLHSEIDALERVEILRELRTGAFDVLVGINLLREGLDLPEVSLVAIIDADKEGFLRSDRSLIQTAGRAARNVGGLVILYADHVTHAMQVLIDETERRRAMQTEYNEKHGITPQTVRKSIEEVRQTTVVADEREAYEVRPIRADMPFDQAAIEDPVLVRLSDEEKRDLKDRLTKEMLAAAEGLRFEEAASIRDRIDEIEGMLDGEE